MLASRKTIRLKDHDYNASGAYFVTICTKDKKKLLAEITGSDLQEEPRTEYSKYGKLVQQQLESMSDFYEDIVVEKYVVMPNHVHLLIRQVGNDEGAVGDVPPTDFPNVSKLSRFVGTFKRFCNQQCDVDLWQSRFHDHIIRNEADYLRIWEYIDTNPQKWQIDCFFTE